MPPCRAVPPEPQACSTAFPAESVSMARLILRPGREPARPRCPPAASPAAGEDTAPATPCPGRAVPAQRKSVPTCPKMSPGGQKGRCQALRGRRGSHRSVPRVLLLSAAMAGNGTARNGAGGATRPRVTLTAATPSVSPTSPGDTGVAVTCPQQSPATPGATGNRDPAVSPRRVPPATAPAPPPPLPPPLSKFFM